MAGVILAVCGLGVACGAWAQSKPKGPAIPAGSYATERGWGTLEITGAGPQQFRLVTAGGEAQACLMKGELTGRTAKLPTLSGGKPCALRFTRVGQGASSGFKLEETSKNNVCREFCGPDAQFAGQYYRVTNACQPASIQKEQDRAKVQIENKAFIAARDRLRPLLRDCQKTLDPWTEAKLRNDLAATHFRIGDFRQCRDTLAPLNEYADQSDANIRRRYPQAEAELIIEIITLTRILREQCPAN
ncbi:MAG: hypothetical protein SF172_16330 [Burkholderiales bacterium]|nr:hypothetical protein [Burkholderiales bacterium]